MSLDKITVTLYDLFGYVLPGFVVIFGLSVIEATFLHGHTFFLARLVKNPAVLIVLAYFAGHIMHATASWLKEHLRGFFTDERSRLTDRVYSRVKEEVTTFYGLPIGDVDGPGLSTLEAYQLSEAYVAVSGGYIDRDVYLAREGFAKSAMAAFVFLFLIFVVCAFRGGAAIQMQNTPAALLRLTWYGTLLASAVFLGAATVFRRQFMFFSRIKNNYTMLSFLAYRQKERSDRDAKDQDTKAPVQAA